LRSLTFCCHPPRGDRRHFVTEADVRVLLGRLPAPLWERLRAVRFNDQAKGRRTLGYVTRGRNEISLCALPPRVSLSPSLRRSQAPAQFGAVRGCQWPTLAVRRFMLYDVFLHEVGHLQVVDSKAKASRRKFAGETRAQEFAERWCRELWSRPFDHPDPAHNPPSREETEALHDGWRAAHADYKRAALREKAERNEEAVLFLTRAVERYPGHAMALERLGVLTYAGRGTTESAERASDLLSWAIRLDPTLSDAALFLALALARQGREAEARRGFERAILLDPYPPLATSMYADALADWGSFAEAEALFLRAIRRDGRCALTIRDYGRTLLRAHNPGAENNLGRAVALFERAVALDPGDAESHYRLGDALLCVDGQRDRAIAHLERASRLDPAHAKAAKALAEAEAERKGPDAS
jgi:tetratricopeptide (TPR) repeat protein